MKIFFNIAYLYPSQKGGPANSIYWLAKALTKAGVQTTVVATDAGIQKNTIPVDRWVETEAGKLIYRQESNYIFWPKLIWESIFQIRKADIIHLTSLFAFPSFVVAILSVLRNKKIIWSPRGELDRQALIYSTWKKTPFVSLIKLFLSRNSTFHATSEEEVQNILSAFGSNTKIIKIPNLIELPTVVPPIAEVRNYLLFIGRIHPIKSIDSLIRALAISKLFKSSRYTMVIAGAKTTYGETLEALTQELGLTDKIHFTGQVEGKEKQHLYANAYFTFLPSHTENFGNVVIESLAQETPVIASKGTPWQLLEEYNAGYWVENSAVSLSENIDKILSLPYQDYQLMRQRARILCEDRFDINKNIGMWLNAYNEILNE